MKRIVATLVLALGMLPASAFAFCTQTAITSTATSTKILAANTSSSAPRRFLYLTAGGACGTWCSVGDTAAEGLGFFVAPGVGILESQILPQQLPPNSFPQALNGQVNCLLPANQTCSQTTVNVCAQ
jgi:hypothetical protein